VLAIDGRLRFEGGSPVAPLVFLSDLPSPIDHLLLQLRTDVCTVSRDVSRAVTSTVRLYYRLNIVLLQVGQGR